MPCIQLPFSVPSMAECCTVDCAGLSLRPPPNKQRDTVEHLVTERGGGV